MYKLTPALPGGRRGEDQFIPYGSHMVLKKQLALQLLLILRAALKQVASGEETGPGRV